MGEVNKKVCDCCEISKPKKINNFMFALINEARRDSFMDFCKYSHIDYETDYKEIKDWFGKLGIQWEKWEE